MKFKKNKSPKIFKRGQVYRVNGDYFKAVVVLTKPNKLRNGRTVGWFIRENYRENFLIDDGLNDGWITNDTLRNYSKYLKTEEGF